ncbi:hypothetical protein EVAR_66717_1 [Eumeta japonica]|uniref:Uncharacterized protein n=1 Tax=Eumeta variegata TaxID=151549 RepID=A0A4C2A0X9_EUMVA|nr:hypothetical protein EVAR_66717_1 [Eumeta japonica]
MRSLGSMCKVCRKERCRNSDVRERCDLKENIVTRIERGSCGPKGSAEFVSSITCRTELIIPLGQKLSQTTQNKRLLSSITSNFKCTISHDLIPDKGFKPRAFLIGPLNAGPRPLKTVVSETVVLSITDSLTCLSRHRSSSVIELIPKDP